MVLFGFCLCLGYLTWSRIKDYYKSYRESNFPSQEIYDGVYQWLEQSMTWTTQSVLVRARHSTYWKTVGFTMNQLMGLVEGYNAVSDMPLTMLDLFALNSIGDMDDLIPAVNYTQQKALKREVSPICKETWCMLQAEANSHCSVLIKPINGELYAAHEMWSSYLQMLPLWKEYKFEQTLPGLRSTHVAFSSWPGMLSSEDDFYITGAKLVVMETTNNVYNLSLYERLRPQSVVSWIRAITANYLSHDARTWHGHMLLYNSGTYNNQWMVLDMKKHVPGSDKLPKDTLIIGSQLPDFYEIGDVSEWVNLHGYWASYNVPYFKNAWLLAGYGEVEKVQGRQVTWDGAPRAQIFRQRQGNVTDMASYKKLMRYNNWQNDPLSLDCPMNQIASRGDLTPPNASPNCYSGAFGAVNGKITSSSRIPRYQIEFVGGPTHDTQPVFAWTDAVNRQFNTAHYGQPKVWNFDWQTVKSPYV